MGTKMLNKLLLFSVAFLTSSRCYSDSVAAACFRSILQKQIKDIKDAGTYKSERVITSKQKSQIYVQGNKKWILKLPNWIWNLFISFK